MRFRLFRSRAFWFGLPGLVILLWGWVDSFSRLALAGFFSPGGGICGSEKGNLFVAKEAGVGLNWSIPMAHAERMPESFNALAWAGLLVWRARKCRQAPVPEGKA